MVDPARLGRRAGRPGAVRVGRDLALAGHDARPDPGGRGDRREHPVGARQVAPALGLVPPRRCGRLGCRGRPRDPHGARRRGRLAPGACRHARLRHGVERRLLLVRRSHRREQEPGPRPTASGSTACRSATSSPTTLRATRSATSSSTTTGAGRSARSAAKPPGPSGPCPTSRARGASSPRSRPTGAPAGTCTRCSAVPADRGSRAGRPGLGLPRPRRAGVSAPAHGRAAAGDAVAVPQGADGDRRDGAVAGSGTD